MYSMHLYQLITFKRYIPLGVQLKNENKLKEMREILLVQDDVPMDNDVSALEPNCIHVCYTVIS